MRVEAYDRLEDAEPRGPSFCIGGAESPLCRPHFGLLYAVPCD